MGSMLCHLIADIVCLLYSIIMLNGTVMSLFVCIHGRLCVCVFEIFSALCVFIVNVHSVTSEDSMITSHNSA